MLLVEDDPLLKRAIAEDLSEYGFTVYTAKDGWEALRLITLPTAVDALFVDVNLPGHMDGLTLARRVRTLRPAVRVIYTSGHVEAGELKEAVAGSHFISRIK